MKRHIVFLVPLTLLVLAACSQVDSPDSPPSLSPAGPAAQAGYTYQSQFGSSGTGDGQFGYPFGVAVDSSGNIYVADTNNNRIQKFSPPTPFTPERYIFDFTTASTTRILYRVREGQGVSYSGTGTALQDTVPVIGYRYLGTRKLEGNQAKVISDGGNKVMTVVKPNTSMPNPDGGILRLKPPMAYKDLALESLTLKGKAGAAAIYIFSNGETGDITTLPDYSIKLDGSAQTVNFKSLTDVAVIHISATRAFSVDEVTFETQP